MIRDPNWDGPGPGPLIDDGESTPEVTPEQTAQIETAAQTAGGFFTGSQQDYIDDLVANRSRPGVQPGAGTFDQRMAALNTLITEGKAKPVSQPDDDDDDDAKKEAKKTGGGGNDFDRDQTDAFGSLKELLGRLGLSGLATNVRDLIARGVLDGDAILFELRETPEFKTRFAGNAARVKAGLPELRPLVYVALEAQYRETMRANGLNAELYDNVKDFQALIEGDVSNAELQRRIVNGYRAVNEADPEVIRQMQELYNVTPGQLAQYFLDPTNMAPTLEKQAAAAAFAARGKEQGKMQLDKLTAEDLVNRGYSEAQAMAAFKILGEQKGLYEEMSGETALTEGQKVGSVFGFDVDSVEAVKKRQATRKSLFSGGGSYTKTTGQTSGTVQTGLGVAE